MTWNKYYLFSPKNRELIVKWKKSTIDTKYKFNLSIEIIIKVTLIGTTIVR